MLDCCDFALDGLIVSPKFDVILLSYLRQKSTYAILLSFYHHARSRVSSRHGATILCFPSEVNVTDSGIISSNLEPLSKIPEGYMR